MTHKQKVLALLSDGEPHDHLSLYRLGCVAHSRVSDLRRDGHNIVAWRDGDSYMYQLVGALNDVSPTQAAGAASGEASLSGQLADGDPSWADGRPLTSAAPGALSVPQPSLTAGANGWASGEGNEPVPGAVHPDQLALTVAA